MTAPRPATLFRLTVVSLALATAMFGVSVAPSAALAVDHTAIAPRAGFGHEGAGHERFGGMGHERFEQHRAFRRSPSFGLFYGAPAVVVPPPLYYDPSYDPSYPSYADPSYSYAPVPLSNMYVTGNGYCRDYQTNIGVETACQGADGVWRFIN